jgi:hypothetical protein
MPQETNLNVSPYFDDFDINKGYYKVLFKPGYPVQARELTTLQSILQNQIEQFGNHIFKEGSVVIPGNIIYKNDLNSVIIEESYQGVPSYYYLDSLLGSRIKGQRSGVTATLENYIKSGNGVDRTTLFVKYLSSDTQTNSQRTFIEGENLLLDQDAEVLDPDTIDDDEPSEILIQSGEGFATIVSENAISLGSAVYLEEGIYFLRGYFVNVPTSILYLDPYSNVPSAKVGFRIYEDIKTVVDDNTLYDNAQGFSNYSAPGSDRFSIFVKLDQVPLDSNDTDNFVQLLEINAGQLISLRNTPEYNILSQELARRTFNESGNYYVNPPIVRVNESLNNFKGNNGLFNENQLTYDDNIPSEDLGTYSVSPLTAYVSGFEIETISPTFLDFPKPRDTKTLIDQSINYFTGPTLSLNRVHGSPLVSIANTYYVSLRDSRVGASSTSAPGNEIGLARVYDFALESGSYSASNPNENQWDISLYDIQTYTTLTLNEPITLSTPTHIKGKESGAVGFLRYDVSSGVALTVYTTNGSFSLGEKLIFDGIENTRVTKSAKSYGISDVKSLYGTVGSAYTFTADTVQVPSIQIGQVEITGQSSGISTVTTSNTFFAGIVNVGNLVAFSNPGFTTSTFAKVLSVTDRSLTISGVTSVTGVCNGSLPLSTINPSDFRIISTPLQSSEDNSLYTVLPKSYISNVDLTKSQLTIRKQFNVTITSNSTGVITADSNETFLPFDEERYALIREDGTTESLSEDKFTFTSGSNSITINGLSGNGNAKLIATLRKTNITSKIKNRNRIKTLIIDKSNNPSSGIGSITLNDGLVYGNYPYGTRVQDEEICLLEPDVTTIYGVFESNDFSTPDIPSLVLSSLTGPTGKTGDLLVGEEFIGERSNSIGIYVEKINDLSVGFNYLNSSSFIVGETVRFKESGITATIVAIDTGDNDISSSFYFDSNQKETIYDYSKLIRRKNTKQPTKKLKIVLESASFSNSDSGDITTVNSYNQFNYSYISNIYDNLKNSDILDIRPRVSSITPTENSRSPFEFLARNFTASGNSASNILASDESILLSYSYYLPRIDSIVLGKDGSLQVKNGISAEQPQRPIINEDVLEVASVYLPPYLSNIDEVGIDLKEHKRYRMSDITKLETRIDNLEYYTTLSLLEVNTSTLSVTDSNGVNRFKSGFFVDNFSTKDIQDRLVVYRNSIDVDNLELRPNHFTTAVDLLLGTNSSIGVGSSVNPLQDARIDTNLIGSGVKRTGQLVTLDYEEVPEIVQPYASRAVNVNPYIEDFYTGTISLFPSSDVWLDQVRNKSNEVFVDRDFEELAELLEYDPQSGFAGGEWNSSENIWVIPGKRTSFGDRVLETNIIPYMRSRNVEFTANRFKPLTRVYPFFSGVDLSKFITPKLIEVRMESGSFIEGETVIGTFDIASPTFNRSGGNGLGGKNSVPEITFRVAKQNHKYGDYLNPTDIYTVNPYDSNSNIPATYSSTSTIINVDTYSLSNQPQGEFYGYISTGMKLRGRTSEAFAVVTDVRLITDRSGTVIGSFFIPNPNVDVNPRFECGSKIFRLTSSESNSLVYGTYTTSAEEKYVSEGKINTVQENMIVSRPIRIEAPEDEPVIPGPGAPVPPPPTADPTPSSPSPSPSSPSPTPTRTTTPATVAPTPGKPAPTIVYYNYNEPQLQTGGANRLKDLANAAGLPNNLVNKIDPNMTAKQERRIVSQINNSNYAQSNNIAVSTGNTKNGVKTTIAGSAVSLAGSTTAQGATNAKINEPPAATNKNNNKNNNNNGGISSIVPTIKGQPQFTGNTSASPPKPAPQPAPPKPATPKPNPKPNKPKP